MSAVDLGKTAVDLDKVAPDLGKTVRLSVPDASQSKASMRRPDESGAPDFRAPADALLRKPDWNQLTSVLPSRCDFVEVHPGLPRSTATMITDLAKTKVVCSRRAVPWRPPRGLEKTHVQTPAAKSTCICTRSQLRWE